VFGNALKGVAVYQLVRNAAIKSMKVMLKVILQHPVTGAKTRERQNPRSATTP
jgi:hypothetical protein